MYRLRRAVNFALHRRVIADTYGWPPADHYLPPGMPGHREAHLYPTGRPDPSERARSLAAAAAAQCWCARAARR